MRPQEVQMREFEVSLVQLGLLVVVRQAAEDFR